MVVRKGIETRYTGNIERRSEKGDGMTVSGYALKYEEESGLLKGRYLRGLGYVDFREVIEKGALGGTDLSDVRLLYDHDTGSILGRTTSGTLVLDVDDVGLRFEATLPNTTLGKDVMENIRNGNIYQCSFGFSMGEDGDEIVEGEDGTYTRLVKNILAIDDISVVTYPAYGDTDFEIALRSVEDFKKKEKDSVIRDYKRLQSVLKLEALREEVRNGFN